MNFYFDYSNTRSTSFINSNFKNFLQTPITVENDGQKIVSKNFQSQQTFGTTPFEVIGCKFIKCAANENNKSGGAIRYICPNSAQVTVYSSTFEECSATNGDGGAIFVCSSEKSTEFDPTHELINAFNSKYCCYSKCSATGNGETSGYGPVMFIFANSINVYYSTAAECPAEGQSYGAQFDLKSRQIESSYINSTKGKANYCCSMEYRLANQGHFTYQTFVDLEGCFLSSFSKLNSENLQISDCNYVNNKIVGKDGKGSIIYVNDCEVTISNFCFAGIQIIGDAFNFVFFENRQGEHKINFKDSYIEKTFSNHLANVITSNVQFYDDNKEKITNRIDQLGLGPCQGEMTPPPTIFSKTFAPTLAFTGSADFSESRKFSSSEKFAKTDAFTGSGIFSDSHEFSKSDIFSESDELPTKEVLTKTAVFSQSDHFTSSKDFSQSSAFSQSETSELIPTIVVVVDRDVDLQENGKGKGLSTGAIAGIAVGAAAAVAAIVAFFIIWAKKRPRILSEGVDMNDIETNSINTANPIYGQGSDDPFKEDFNN